MATHTQPVKPINMTIAVDQPLLDRIHQQAVAEKRSRAQVVRLAVTKYLQELESA